MLHLKEKSTMVNVHFVSFVFKWRSPTFVPVQMIDGEAFLLLTQTDIVKIMSIKLGPALKISTAILMLKSTDEVLKWPHLLSDSNSSPNRLMCVLSHHKQGGAQVGQGQTDKLLTLFTLHSLQHLPWLYCDLFLTTCILQVLLAKKMSVWPDKEKK